MRKLEMGMTYPERSGKTFTVVGINSHAERPGPEARGSDSWWRHAEGPKAGLFVEAEGDLEYGHHVDWKKFDAMQIPESTQLELF